MILSIKVEDAVKRLRFHSRWRESFIEVTEY